MTSHRSGTTWGWVTDDRTFIFGRSISLMWQAPSGQRTWHKQKHKEFVRSTHESEGTETEREKKQDITRPWMYPCRKKNKEGGHGGHENERQRRRRRRRVPALFISGWQNPPLSSSRVLPPYLRLPLCHSFRGFMKKDNDMENRQRLKTETTEDEASFSEWVTFWSSYKSEANENGS